MPDETLQAEPKMCPLLAAALVARGVGVDRDDAPCRREQCAWWVARKEWVRKDEFKVVGACAMAHIAGTVED